MGISLVGLSLGCMLVMPVGLGLKLVDSRSVLYTNDIRGAVKRKQHSGIPHDGVAHGYQQLSMKVALRRVKVPYRPKLLVAALAAIEIAPRCAELARTYYA